MARKSKKRNKKNSAALNYNVINLNSAIAAMNDQIDEAMKLGKSMKSSMTNYVDKAYSAQQQADAYNANEAQKSRDFTQMMSSTAHQREVADLKAAGLSPILSANAGAPVGTSAAAQSSNALTGVFGEMAMSAMGALTSLTQTLNTNATTVANTAANAEANIYGSNVSKYASELTARTNLTMNQATNQMNYNIAKLNSMTSKEVANIAGKYGLSSAQVSAFASKYASELAYDASLYGTNVNSNTTIQVANANNETAKFNTTEGVVAGLIKDLIGFVTGKKMKKKKKK